MLENQTLKLPQNIQVFFDSDKPRLELEKSYFLYGIKPAYIAFGAKYVGSIFLGNLKLTDLPKMLNSKIIAESTIIYGLSFELNRRIFNRFPEYFKDAPILLDQWQRMKSNPVISEEEAIRKVLEIEPWILEEEKEREKETMNMKEKERQYQASLVKLPLSEALKNYPEIFDQVITSAPIKTKGSTDPIRPTVKNWLEDYTYNLGYESHSSIARGNYMFQSENTKALFFEDRQKLSHILKSYDEKTPITIDAAIKQIIFPAAEATPRPRPITYNPPVAPEPVRKMDGTGHPAKTYNGGIGNPVYSAGRMQPTGQPARPPQNNLENSYEHYHIPQQKPGDPSKEQPLSISQNFRNAGMGSSEFRQPEKPKASPLVFSSPQKLPFEKEKEQKFSPSTPITPPAPPRPAMPQIQQAPLRPTTPQRPLASPTEPQPLHIAPASPYDEEKEELPRNVVNLRE